MTKSVGVCAVCRALLAHARGPKAHTSTLTREDAVIIRRQARRGIRLRDIAKAFSISTARVRTIVTDPLARVALAEA